LANAGTLWVKLGLSDKEFNDTLKKTENSIKRFGDRMGNLGNRITQGVSLPFAAAGGAALKMAADMEQAEVALTTLTGSAEKAKKQIEAIKKLAAQSPFAFPELVDATRKMLAYGFSIEQTVPMLKTLGDATSALGLGKEGIDRVTRALGQMKAKSLVSAEEMNQLTEAGIGAWGYLAKAIGVTTAEAMEMAKNRMIDGATGISAILEGIANDPKFKDGMLKQTQTLAGIWSNFKDQLGFTLTDIGNQIVKSLDLKDRLSGLITTLKNLSDWFANLNPAVRNFAVNVALITAALGPLLIVIGKVSTGWAAMIGLMRMLPQLGLVSAIKEIGFALTAVAGGAATASEAAALVAGSFTPFLAGGAIAAGLAGIAYLWWKIGEQARLAKMKISDVSSATELMSKKTFLEGEIKSLLNKKQHSDDLTNLQRQGLNISNNDPWTPQDQQDLENTQAELRKVWGLLNQKNRPETEAYQLDLPKSSGGNGAESQRTVSAVMTDLNKSLSAAESQSKLFGDAYDLIAAKTNIVKSAIVELIGMGLKPQDKALAGLMAQYRGLTNLQEQSAQLEAINEENAQAATDVWARRQQQIDAEIKKEQNIQNVYTDIDSKLKEIINTKKALGDEYDDLSAKTDLYQSSILSLLTNGVNPEAEKLQGLIATFQQLKVEQKKVEEQQVNAKTATVVLAQATEYLNEITSEAVPESEKLAGELERIASLKGVSPEMTQSLTDLAVRIRNAASVDQNQFTLDAWDQGLQDSIKNWDNWAGQVKKLAVATAQSMQSSFDDFFFAAFTGKLQSLGEYLTQFTQSILSEISGMISKMLTKNLILKLFGSSGYNWYGGTTFFDDTGYAGGFVSGGYISPNKYALVGESGPELIKVGSSGATVTPNSALGGDVQINIINQTGQQFKARQELTQVNGKTMVKNIILELAATDLGFRDAMRLSR
jgi:tape measure domain-containing protein